MKYRNLYMNSSQKSIYVKYEKKQYKTKNKMSVKIVEDAVILPAKQDFSIEPKLWAIGGIMDKDNNFVEESASDELFGGEYEYNEDYIDKSDEEVVFFGPFIKEWEKFLCNQISRLWYVIDDPKKYKIVYCGWNWNQGITDISGKYLELFELLGIQKEQLINIQKPTKFKKIIIPECSFVAKKYYSEEFEKLTDTIVKNAKSHIKRCPDKIYLVDHASATNNNIDHYDQKLKQYLQKKDYRIIYLEKLSLSDQIFYLNHAKTISMMAGNISHNLILCKKENEIVIFNETDQINEEQMVIDHTVPANITYIDIYKRILPSLFGKKPLLIYVSKYLKNWEDDIIKKKTKFSRMDYL